MRRRFHMGRRRRYGRPVQKERPMWATTNFNETAIAGDATLEEMLIFQNQDIVDFNATSLTSIRRIIINGGVAIVPESTTFASNMIALYAALYVTDIDETDTTLITTAPGDILEGGVGRVLWTNCYAFSVAEIPTANVGTNLIPPVARIEIDWKGRLNLRGDDAFLVLGLQYGASVTSTVALSSFSATCRTLQVVA